MMKEMKMVHGWQHRHRRAGRKNVGNQKPWSLWADAVNGELMKYGFQEFKYIMILKFNKYMLTQHYWYKYTKESRWK